MAIGLAVGTLAAVSKTWSAGARPIRVGIPATG